MRKGNEGPLWDSGHWNRKGERPVSHFSAEIRVGSDGSMAKTNPDLKSAKYDRVLTHLMGSYCPGPLPVDEMDTYRGRHVLFPN